MVIGVAVGWGVGMAIGVGVDGILMGVAVGWGVGILNGVAVGWGVGTVIGVTVGIASKSSRRPLLSMLDSCSCLISSNPITLNVTAVAAALKIKSTRKTLKDVSSDGSGMESLARRNPLVPVGEEVCPHKPLAEMNTSHLCNH